MTSIASHSHSASVCADKNRKLKPYKSEVVNGIIKKIQDYPLKYEIPNRALLLLVLESNKQQFDETLRRWDHKYGYKVLRIVYDHNWCCLNVHCNDRMGGEIGVIKAYPDGTVTPWEFGADMC